MFVAIRKEPNGLLYMDKEICSKMTTLKLTREGFDRFRKENPNLNYSYKEIMETDKNTFVLIEENGQVVRKCKEEIYIVIEKRLVSDEELSCLPYNFTKVEIDDEYSDCTSADFNDDLTFSPIKYIDRKQREKDSLRISEIKPRLEQLSQDLIQAQAGAKFDDLEERKQEFQTLHNELRILLGKLPRQYN